MRVMKVVFLLCSIGCLLFLFPACSDIGIPGEDDSPVEETDGYFQVRVLDSLGGNNIENMPVKLYKENNLIIPVSTKCTGADGKTDSFRIKKNKTYQVRCGDGPIQAVSSYQGITTGVDGSTITLYSYTIGAMTHISHKAVQITDVEYSANKITWEKLENGFDLNGLDIAYIRVTARGTAGIEPNTIPGEPYGIGLAINSKVTYDNRLKAEYEKTSEQDGEFFESIALFDVSSDLTFAGGTNSIDIVTYDVANNRTELKLTGTIKKSSGDGDPLVAGILGKELIAFLNLYPVTANIYPAGTVALKSVYTESPADTSDSFGPEDLQRSFSFPDQGNVYGFATIMFMSVNASMQPAGIRGYELFRAEGENPGESDYQLIASRNYGYLNMGASNMGIHFFNDYNEDVTVGTVYHYKVRAFNNSGSTPVMKVGSSHFIPEFKAFLAAPYDYEVVSDTTPGLTFTVSNFAEIMSAAQKFTFTLVVREKALGSGDAYQAEYSYDISSGEFSLKNSLGQFEVTDTASYSDGIVTIDYNFQSALLPGLTYEWDILKPKFEYVQVSDQGIPVGISYSNGNNPAEGTNAINGSFTLTIADDAVNQ